MSSTWSFSAAFFSFSFFPLVHIQFCRQTATDKHALHKAAKCRERLFPCPRDGNFSIFTAGPVALAASCHVIRLSPRGLDQTPVVSRLGGRAGGSWGGGGGGVGRGSLINSVLPQQTCKHLRVRARQRAACTLPFLPFKLSLSEERLRKNK